jgi:hypothetical protein
MALSEVGETFNELKLHFIKGYWSRKLRKLELYHAKVHDTSRLKQRLVDGCRYAQQRVINPAINCCATLKSRGAFVNKLNFEYFKRKFRTNCSTSKIPLTMLTIKIAMKFALNKRRTWVPWPTFELFIDIVCQEFITGFC